LSASPIPSPLLARDPKQVQTSSQTCALLPIFPFGGNTCCFHPLVSDSFDLFLHFSLWIKSRQGRVSILVIAHRDRLVRFGLEWFEAFCERHGTKIVMMNNEQLSPEKEMVEDLLAIITVFSGRFHGLRSYKKSKERDTAHADTEGI